MVRITTAMKPTVIIGNEIQIGQSIVMTLASDGWDGLPLTGRLRSDGWGRGRRER
jgi:hypothetical protein